MKYLACILSTFIFVSSISLFAQTESKVVQVSGKSNLVCALFADGKIFCWGKLTTDAGFYHFDVTLPTQLKVIGITVGENHGCAMLADGQVVCWGTSAKYWSGRESKLQSVTIAHIVSFRNKAKMKFISAGENGTCAISTTNDLYCWGFLDFRKHGHYEMIEANSPLQLGGESKFKFVDTTYGAVCAVSVNDNIYCWSVIQVMAFAPGENIPAKTKAWPKLPFLKNAHILQLKTTGGPMCILYTRDNEANGSETQNSVMCLGTESVLLGQPAVSGLSSLKMIEGATPIPFPTGFNPTDLTVSATNVCALSSTGILICWGSNAFHQISPTSSYSIGSAIDEIGENNIPISLGALYRIKSVAVGYSDICTSTQTGEAFCWGYSERVTEKQNFANSFSDNPLRNGVVHTQFSKLRSADGGQQ